MSIEEQLDLAMKQRAMLAAIAVGTMQSPCVSEESIRIKNATMTVIMHIFNEDERFSDSIEHELLLASKSYCIEQIEINQLLDDM
jgi:hypothetical protein